jgi:hypothetical protein
MAYFGTLRRVALVRTDVSEERSASNIRVTRIGELGTLAVTSNRRTQRAEYIYIYIFFFNFYDFTLNDYKGLLN